MSINPAIGDFDDVGDMRVSADGLRIETITGGVNSSSWHFPAPPPEPDPPEDNQNNEDDECDECKASGGGASSIFTHSGVLTETHDLATSGGDHPDSDAGLICEHEKARPVAQA